MSRRVFFILISLNFLMSNIYAQQQDTLKEKNSAPQVSDTVRKNITKSYIKRIKEEKVIETRIFDSIFGKVLPVLVFEKKEGTGKKYLVIERGDMVSVVMKKEKGVDGKFAGYFGDTLMIKKIKGSGLDKQFKEDTIKLNKRDIYRIVVHKADTENKKEEDKVRIAVFYFLMTFISSEKYKIEYRSEHIGQREKDSIYIARMKKFFYGFKPKVFYEENSGKYSNSIDNLNLFSNIDSIEEFGAAMVLIASVGLIYATISAVSNNRSYEMLRWESIHY